MELLAFGFPVIPTDEQLICNLLKRKVIGFHSEVNKIIPEVNFEVDPWQLFELAVESSKLGDENRRYLIYKLKSKYPNSKLDNRQTQSGSWTKLGRDINVCIANTETVIATKKILRFFQGDGKIRTIWLMHEYHAMAPDFPDNPERYVIGCLRKSGNDDLNNSVRSTSPKEEGSSRQAPCDHQNDSEDTIREHSPLLPSNSESRTDNGLLECDSSSAIQGQNSPSYTEFTDRESEELNNYLLDVLRSPTPEESEFLNQEESEFLNSPPEVAQTHYSSFSPTKSLENAYVEECSNTDAETFPAQIQKEQGQCFPDGNRLQDGAKSYEIWNPRFAEQPEAFASNHLGSSIPSEWSKTTKRMYNDTKAETFPTLVVENSSFFNGQTCAKRSRQMQMIPVYNDTQPSSSCDSSISSSTTNRMSNIGFPHEENLTENSQSYQLQGPEAPAERVCVDELEMVEEAVIHGTAVDQPWKQIPLSSSNEGLNMSPETALQSSLDELSAIFYPPLHPVEP